MNQTEKLAEALQEMIIQALEHDLHGEIVDNAKKALESYKDGWVSVEERLPEYMDCVIVHTNLGVITESQYTGEGNKFQTDDYIFTATHWQPLPQKPVI